MEASMLCVCLPILFRLYNMLCECYWLLAKSFDFGPTRSLVPNLSAGSSRRRPSGWLAAHYDEINVARGRGHPGKAWPMAIAISFSQARPAATGWLGCLVSAPAGRYYFPDSCDRSVARTRD